MALLVPTRRGVVGRRPLLLALLLGPAVVRACSVPRCCVDGWRVLLLLFVPDAVERLARGSADAVLAAAADHRCSAKRLLGHQSACPFRLLLRGVSLVIVSPASKLKTTN